MVSRLETGEAIGGRRGAEVVSLGLAVAQEGIAHDTADAVTTQVGGIGTAMTVAEPTCHWLAAAHHQGFTQHI